MAQVGPREVVVAMHTSSGTVQLNYYRFPLLNAQTQEIAGLGLNSLEPVGGLAVSVEHRRLSSAASDLGETIVAYKQNQTGKLKIARWRVTES